MLKCDILNSETLTYEDSTYTQEQILDMLSQLSVNSDTLSTTQSYEIIDCPNSGFCYRFYKTK